jgi:hydroxymethylglutaryl-CoA lyase
MFPEKILIKEVGCREGFQIHPDLIPIDLKLEIIAKLIEAGLTELEVTSFVRPDRVPQMADAEQLIEKLPLITPNIKYSALTLNAKGYLKALKFNQLNHKIYFYTGINSDFLVNNLGASYTHQLTEWLDLKIPLEGLVISSAFTDSTTTECLKLINEVTTTIGYTPKEIVLADSEGIATPNLVALLVNAIREFNDNIIITLHLHNTNGLALANAYQGLLLGIDRYESSFGGVGGCPFLKGASGNIATEELVLLAESLGCSTGINPELICEATQLFDNIPKATLSSRFYDSWVARKKNVN